MNLQIGIAISILVLATACTPEEHQRRQEGDPISSQDVAKAMEHYDIEEYFPGGQKDTLLTNMVTYI